MSPGNETRIREGLASLRAEMRWLDVLRMCAAGDRPLLTKAELEAKVQIVRAAAGPEWVEPNTDEAIAGKELVREELASFALPRWLRTDLKILEAWFLDRAASNGSFAYVAPERADDQVDEFARAALGAVKRIFDLMTELEPMCTAATEPVGAFDFWQLRNWAGFILRGEVAQREWVGPAIGTPEEIADLDRHGRRMAEQVMDQHARLADKIRAKGPPLTGDELHAELNRRSDPAVRERLSGAARPWAPGSVVLMPPPDDD